MWLSISRSALETCQLPCPCCHCAHGLLGEEEWVPVTKRLNRVTEGYHPASDADARPTQVSDFSLDLKVGMGSRMTAVISKLFFCAKPTRGACMNAHRARLSWSSSSGASRQRQPRYLRKKRLFGEAGGLQGWELSQVTKKGMFPGKAVLRRPALAPFWVRSSWRGLKPPSHPEAGEEAALPCRLQAGQQRSPHSRVWF